MTTQLRFQVHKKAYSLIKPFEHLLCAVEATVGTSGLESVKSLDFILSMETDRLWDKL